MLSNDLLSYSIMRNGDRAVTHSCSHYAPAVQYVDSARVSLPPITSVNGLTEDNLTSLNNFTTTRSLSGLQSYGFNQNQPTYRSASESSQGGSPRLSSSSEYSNNPVQASSPVSGSASPQLASADFSEKKRRQRLGPSCDSCRARKVKCNAEVILLSRNVEEEEAEEMQSLGEASRGKLLAGEAVLLEESFSLVISNGKLVKFRPCSSCATRELDCCFSKGFTKEDIVHSKRSSSLSAVGSVSVLSSPKAPSRVKKRSDVAASARKSSCAACRKRKVKCVMNVKLNKCVGCVKKDSECSFT
ncbi:hypothetical protein FT663_03955 [Candidozyma haemuli var. vulneris]|uniref:Zn(2)-C6 fungal-type domain-containing protein n=1 Tax=Candidozyma haemuli TaxID=45357 RepID=A0A2V1AV29_9ASCO|nr:hypothetical protein CXQ85_000686 [[Candida] haemuloni]KAF3987394.1 hypothetical protein FT662_04009 [[Candida] haemuloni var. vulneris]KAF3988599.1 hypothetical protein FT663_03955 [[Candida] haemuloni var. vulneris]PVH21698.1 hypothetical protein CXQ85_000686 [[Candida] haemuloni]